MLMDSYEIEKRNELIWALDLQKYSQASIGRIFNINRSTIMRIVGERPKGWLPKWIKKD